MSAHIKSANRKGGKRNIFKVVLKIFYDRKLNAFKSETFASNGVMAVTASKAKISAEKN